MTTVRSDPSPRHLPALLAAALWLGCGSPATPDAGGHDAGATDAGLDAGAVDTGGGSDAGGWDAGWVDAGAPDAGGPDAGPGDAGSTDAGCGCGGKQCLPDGGCGDCLGDTDCPVGTPVCDVARSACVQCRAAPDSCAAGTYCLAQACVPGCGRASDCASGVCLSTHDCLTCTSDAECAGGRRCGSGTCSAPCTGSCDGGACCGGRCVDPSRDPGHCGGCDQPCAASDFCGGGHCRTPALANTCAIPTATAVLDGADDAVSVSLANALAAACVPALSVRAVDQLDAGVLNPVTGEPLVTGELLCVAGGSFRQRAIAWLEANHLAPVSDTSTASDYRYGLRDGGVAATGAATSLDATHDVFVIQLVRTPSGAAMLNAAGFYSQGTAAGAWYFVHRLLPTRASLTEGWYVVDWRDTVANGLPDDGDTWTPLTSGL